MELSRETFIACEAAFEEAKLVLFGAPYDSTTSYRPGARLGPSAIRHESYALETYSPYLDADLTDERICDAGDLELPFGDTNQALDLVEATAKEIVSAKKLPLMTGGEHLMTLGAVRAAVKEYPGLHIIQFDAHADLRDDYLGVTLSHATVMRRCYELTGDNRIHQFCIRSGEREEFRFAAAHTDLHPFTFDGIESCVSALKRDYTPVYVTIDLDCLDPGVLPGTGTAEAGGVRFPVLLDAIRLVSSCNVVGADVCELAPNIDTTGASTAVACKVVRELMLALLSKHREVQV